jgi:hypothetical protein
MCVWHQFTNFSSYTVARGSGGGASISQLPLQLIVALWEGGKERKIDSVNSYAVVTSMFPTVLKWAPSHRLLNAQQQQILNVFLIISLGGLKLKYQHYRESNVRSASYKNT